jgi:soluble lytic murein transglycosylase-like protein
MYSHKMLRGNMTTYAAKCLAGTLFLLIVVTLLGVQSHLFKSFSRQSPQKYITYSVPLQIPAINKASQTYEQEVSYFSEKLNQAYDIPLNKSDYFADWILTASHNTGVPRKLLASVIMTESNYEPSSVSSFGAVGLGQIRMEYWREICPYADTDSKENVKCAALILRQYYNSYCNRDWVCALKVYNVGPSNLNKNKYFIAASNRYVKKIFHNISLFNPKMNFNQHLELAANFL